MPSSSGSGAGRSSAPISRWRSACWSIPGGCRPSRPSRWSSRTAPSRSSRTSGSATTPRPSSRGPTGLSSSAARPAGAPRSRGSGSSRATPRSSSSRAGRSTPPARGPASWSSPTRVTRPAPIARSYARDVPDERWFALTQLDRMRAVSAIAAKAGVPADELRGVRVWGNHSETVFLDVQGARVGDRPLSEFLPDLADWVPSVLRPAVAGRSAEILSLGGHSPAGTRCAGDPPDDPVDRHADRLWAATSTRGSSPTAVTASPAGSSSASRSAPRTAGPGRSTMASTSTTTPSPGSPPTSPNWRTRR